MSAAALLVAELVESDAPVGFVYLDGVTGRLALDCGPLTPCEVLRLLVETGSRPGDRWSTSFTAAAVVARCRVTDVKVGATLNGALVYAAHACDGSWYVRTFTDGGGFVSSDPPAGGQLAAALAAVVSVDSDTLSAWKGDTA